MEEKDPGELIEPLAEALAHGARLLLFLDYDGTLAAFARTPGQANPDPKLIALLSRLVQRLDLLRVVILSGRSLSQIQRLLPVPDLLMSGTYGLEFRGDGGEVVYRLDFATNRPVVDQIKPRWEALIAGREGFYLEDKGWSLALHARFASQEEADSILEKARQCTMEVGGKDTFHLLGGDRFLELAPTVADKGQGVAILLDRFHWPDRKLVYLGDDDKDEQAFGVIKQREGFPILVSESPRPTQADYRLSNPAAVRAWLDRLARRLDEIPARETHPEAIPKLKRG